MKTETKYRTYRTFQNENGSYSFIIVNVWFCYADRKEKEEILFTSSEFVSSTKALLAGMRKSRQPM